MPAFSLNLSRMSEICTDCLGCYRSPRNRGYCWVCAIEATTFCDKCHRSYCTRHVNLAYSVQSTVIDDIAGIRRIHNANNCAACGGTTINDSVEKLNSLIDECLKFTPPNGCTLTKTQLMEATCYLGDNVCTDDLREEYMRKIAEFNHAHVVPNESFGTFAPPSILTRSPLGSPSRNKRPSEGKNPPTKKTS